MDEGTHHANDAPGTWDEDDSKIFVEFGEAMVPGREEIERTLLDMIPAEPDETFLAVEIGTGAGWLSAAVLREYPKVRILALGRLPADAREGYPATCTLRRPGRASSVQPGGGLLDG